MACEHRHIVKILHPAIDFAEGNHRFELFRNDRLKRVLPHSEVRVPVTGMPDKVSGCAETLSGSFRYSVRMLPLCCPDTTEMGVRMLPKYAMNVAEKQI